MPCSLHFDAYLTINCSTISGTRCSMTTRTCGTACCASMLRALLDRSRLYISASELSIPQSMLYAVRALQFPCFARMLIYKTPGTTILRSFGNSLPNFSLYHRWPLYALGSIARRGRTIISPGLRCPKIRTHLLSLRTETGRAVLHRYLPRAIYWSWPS